MKAVSLAVVMVALAAMSSAQTPNGPAAPAAQPQAAAPANPAAQPQAAATGSSATTAGAPAQTVELSVPAPNVKITVPADTTIPMVLENTINTKSAHVGQFIYCESIYPITVGNHVIIPKGTSIRGTVTQVVRPGHMKGRAQLGLRFDELVLPNGTTRHLRATLSGFGSEGDGKFKQPEGKVEGSGSKGKDAATIARTTIPGAEIGTIVGAAKGAPVEGLGIGSAAGLATGLAWILATRGKDLVLPYGTSLELQLLQPVSFDRDEVQPPSRYDDGPAVPRREYR